MFNSVEYVRDVCGRRNLPISQLEKDCGFANGYMNPKKLKKIPYDRAKIIAEYLGLSLEYLLTGAEETEKAPTPESERKVKEEDIRAAFFGGADDLSEEEMDAMWDDAKDYIQYKLEQRRRKKDGGSD